MNITYKLCEGAWHTVSIDTKSQLADFFNGVSKIAGYELKKVEIGEPFYKPGQKFTLKTWDSGEAHYVLGYRPMADEGFFYLMDVDRGQTTAIAGPTGPIPFAGVPSPEKNISKSKLLNAWPDLRKAKELNSDRV